MRFLLGASLLFLSAFIAQSATWKDLEGTAHNPFSNPAHVHVFLFLRTDCPLANRYAPELNKLSKRYRGKPVDFWLVYPDRNAQSAAIRKQITEFQLVGTPLLDPNQTLVHLAEATVSPEAAVFDSTRHLMYLGRIDDRVAGFGISRPVATKHDLSDAIAETLAGKPVSEPRTRAFGCYLADVQ